MKSEIVGVKFPEVGTPDSVEGMAARGLAVGLAVGVAEGLAEKEGKSDSPAAKTVNE